MSVRSCSAVVPVLNFSKIFKNIYLELMLENRFIILIPCIFNNYWFSVGNGRAKMSCRNLSVELLDSNLGLVTLIEAHKSNSLGHTRGRVEQYTAGYDATALAKVEIQVLSAPVTRYAAHVQIGAFD